VVWSGLIRPPQLQNSDTDAGTQRTATWLELFFDLAFLLVVAELAVGLRNDLTPHGVLVFAGLFSSVWWKVVGSNPTSGFT
jgi:low temperature requirement protein LtrA